MKEQVITDLLMKLTGTLSDSQLKEVKTAFFITLQDYDIVAKSTEVMVRDDSYMRYLDMFLVYKRTEG